MKSAKANRSVFLQKENTSNKKMNEVTGRASVSSFTKLTAIAGNFLLPRKVKAGFDSPHHHFRIQLSEANHSPVLLRKVGNDRIVIRNTIHITFGNDLTCLHFFL